CDLMALPSCALNAIAVITGISDKYFSFGKKQTRGIEIKTRHAEKETKVLGNTGASLRNIVGPISETKNIIREITQ
ncbi:hypothetical protein, partial [Serratia marcescens]|uniref:hypothetical protein n=1 Tax=Serratia marcescens TaxID=615 RepID=UPI00158DF7DA